MKEPCTVFVVECVGYRIMKNLLEMLRPGIKGKLSIFIGVMLFTLIGAILAVALNQQRKSIEKYSMREVTGRLIPVKRTTQEMQHTVKNLIRIQELNNRVIRRRDEIKSLDKNNKKDDKNNKDDKDVASLYYKKYFDETYLNEIWNLMRTHMSTRAGEEISEEQFEKIRKNAFKLYRTHRKITEKTRPGKVKRYYRNIMRYPGEALDKTLRGLYKYKDAQRNAFLGLDINKYRIETVNLYYKQHFDTYYIDPEKELGHKIKQLRSEIREISDRNSEKRRALMHALSGLRNQKRQHGRRTFTRINSREILSNKKLIKGLHDVNAAFYSQKPIINPVRARYYDRSTSSDFVTTTVTMFHNASISERAMRIKRAMEAPDSYLWKAYIDREKTLYGQFREVSRRIKVRLSELAKEAPAVSPSKDGEFRSLYEEYSKLLKQREDFFEKTRLQYLQKSVSAYERLKVQHEEMKRRYKQEKQEIKDFGQKIVESKAKLGKVNEKKEPDKYRNLKEEWNNLRKSKADKRVSRKLLKKQIRLAKIRIKNYYDNRHEVVDAFSNIRNAALLDYAVIKFDYDPEEYNSYIELKKNRSRAGDNWNKFRAWIIAGCSEFGNCKVRIKRKKKYFNIRSIVGAGKLILSRSEIEKRMWELDSRPLSEIADRLLYENTAGFTRIFFEQTDMTKSIRRELDKLTDTALSIGLRVIFLAFFISIFIVQTIQSIISGANRVGKGDLSVQFEYNGKDELGSLVQSLNQMVDGLKEREELRGELTAAEEIQKQLLPAVMPANMKEIVSFGSFYKAMSGVGGDYYDFVEVGLNEFVFCIADVSNHGVGPAIVMTLMRSQFHGIVARGVTDPEAILLELNDRLYEETPANIFVTILLGNYNKKNSTIRFCSAGHNKSLLYHYKSEKLEELEGGGMPLGAVDNELFGSLLKLKLLKLETGDLFFQFTDGVNEAMDDQRNQFGYERMQKCLLALGKKKPQVIVEGIARAVETFSGKKIFCEGPSELNDDIAMIAFRRVK